MSYIPSDNGRSWRSDTGVQMITYTAIPQNIPGIYQTTLISLGRSCISARESHSGDYVRLQREFDMYERTLREQFGVQVSREEFRTRGYDVQ